MYLKRTIHVRIHSPLQLPAVPRENNYLDIVVDFGLSVASPDTSTTIHCRTCCWVYRQKNAHYRVVMRSKPTYLKYRCF